MSSCALVGLSWRAINSNRSSDSKGSINFADGSQGLGVVGLDASFMVYVFLGGG